MSKLGDDAMAQQYREGVDVYREMASGIYKKKPKLITEHERQVTKKVFMALMFGGGTRTICAQLGVSQAEAKSLITGFYKALPGIRLVSNPRPKDDQWMSRWEPGAIEQRVTDRGFIETPYGRRLYPEQWGGHKMLSKLIQGTAADVMKQAMARVDAFLKARSTGHQAGNGSAHMVSVVHDEIQIDARRDELPILFVSVPARMSDPILSEVLPIPVEMEWTETSWADKIPYEGGGK